MNDLGQRIQRFRGRWPLPASTGVKYGLIAGMATGLTWLALNAATKPEVVTIGTSITMFVYVPAVTTLAAVYAPPFFCRAVWIEVFEHGFLAQTWSGKEVALRWEDVRSVDDVREQDTHRTVRADKPLPHVRVPRMLENHPDAASLIARLAGPRHPLTLAYTEDPWIQPPPRGD